MGIWKLKNEVKIRNKRDTLLLNLHTQLGLIVVVSPRQLNWKATGVRVSLPFSSFPFTKLLFEKLDITINEKLMSTLQTN